jgi:hypothetical protein
MIDAPRLIGRATLKAEVERDGIVSAWASSDPSGVEPNQSWGNTDKEVTTLNDLVAKPMNSWNPDWEWRRTTGGPGALDWMETCIAHVEPDTIDICHCRPLTNPVRTDPNVLGSRRIKGKRYYRQAAK